MIRVPVFACVLLGVVQAAAQDGEFVRFNRDIRPILADKCYACHGPDQNQRQAGFRLDREEDAKADLGGYAAIVPNQTDESELVRRVLSDDADDVMPPADYRKHLTQTEKDLLHQWVAQGANWESHWSWIKPQASAPETGDPSLEDNYVDSFIRNRLKQSGIEPSNRADRITLIRRLYLDLIGLPPTPEQVDAFVQDQRDDAWELLVDELLASPHFGERLAIYWLDLVRYADSVGYHGDQEVSVSPYRDYVIEAFNANMPFDQFTREQLAGDLLDSPTGSQLIASGYNRLGMMSAEGGVQPEEYLTKYNADRVRTTASVWLGVTLGCAECHDHKFDPFTIDDFYSFGAFFADIQERGLYSGANTSGDWGPSIDVPDPELPGLVKPIDEQLAELRGSIIANQEGLDDERMEWEASVRQQIIGWTTSRPVSFASVKNTDYRILDDDSILMTGERSDEDCYFVVMQLPPGTHRGLRVEVLPDESLPANGPGRAGNGNFVITQLLVLNDDLSERTDDLKKVVGLWDESLLQNNLDLVDPGATIEQDGGRSNPYGKWSAASAIDHDLHGPTYGWAILPESGKENELVVNFSRPLELTESGKITVVVQQYHGADGHVLGRFRLSTTSAEKAVASPLKSLPANVANILDTDEHERDKSDTKTMFEYYQSIAPRFAKKRDEIASLESKRMEIVQAHTRTSLITVSKEPREIRVLPRGNWMDKSGVVVAPRIPALLGGKESVDSRRMTRLDLAEWMTHPDNPLTARTLANRLWMLYFGEGLSRVLDDLGSQGEWPSHPGLLDAMAMDLVQSDWNIKHLIRTLVTSETYQQSSAERPDLATLDPYNRLLARQSRFRLEAELIRDNALATSGLLQREIGGRSTRPYQPAGLYRHLNFPTREYQADASEFQYRRGVYTHWQRQFLHPAMKSFDAPAREECTCKRPRSNTPVGALVLLNDPSFVEAARKLAEWTMRSESGDIDEMTRQLFRRALSRWPDERESDVLVELYQSHLEQFTRDPGAAAELAGTGISPVPPGPADRAVGSLDLGRPSHYEPARIRHSLLMRTNN